MRELREIAERVETRDVIYRRPCHGGKAVSRTVMFYLEREKAQAGPRTAEGKGGGVTLNTCEHFVHAASICMDTRSTCTRTREKASTIRLKTKHKTYVSEFCGVVNLYSCSTGCILLLYNFFSPSTAEKYTWRGKSEEAEGRM